MFLKMRGIEKIITFKIDANKLDKKSIFESFDHSQSFFGCRAFVYEKDINPNALVKSGIMQYF